MNWIVIIIIIIVISMTASILMWLYWRFFYFFRDPERSIPAGNNIVSPADGTIVYTNIIEEGYLPITIKKGKKIRLEEITKTDIPPEKLYHVGIFMDLFSVHVNRIPIDGKMEFVKHYKHEGIKNLTMNYMGLRKYLKLKPLYKDSAHILENERKTIRINGVFPLYVVQIADAYVNKIFCWAKEGETMEKGQRYGRIAMGSQVDLVFPYREGMEILVKEFDKVKAGETIIAEYSNIT
ncbi:MAG: phosphatidylserine decarboxylase [Proteobacteria bacterium]|nr:phosphatidylserine decarboxylase [Pseudomonadota bacterium]